MSKNPRQFALWFSVSYGLVSAAWFLGSDRLAGALFTDPHAVARLQAYQGLGFAAVTAILIYFALKRGRGRSQPEAGWQPPAGKSPPLSEEGELSFNRDLFQTLLDSSPDRIYFKDLQSRIIKTNLAHAHKFNLKSAEEMAGKTDFDLFADTHARAALADEQEIIRTGQPLTGKVEKESWKDGRAATWALTTKTPFRNKTGEIIGTIGISKDITALKQAEEELLWKTTFLETLVDSVGVGVLVVDDQAKKVIQNQLTRDLWKIPRPIADNPDDQQQIEFVRSRLKHPQAFSEKVSHLNSHPNEISRDLIELMDGTVMDRYSAPVQSKAGKYFGRLWIFRDITREKNAENALRVSEVQLRATFDSAAIGMALVNLDGQLVKCNPMLAQMLGYSPAELCSMTFAEFTHPDDLAADLQLFRALLAGERNHYELEKRYLHKDGRIIWGRLTVSLVRQTDNAPPLAIGMVEDITAGIWRSRSASRRKWRPSACSPAEWRMISTMCWPLSNCRPACWASMKTFHPPSRRPPWKSFARRSAPPTSPGSCSCSVASKTCSRPILI